jgi:hypothetical protein
MVVGVATSFEHDPDLMALFQRGGPFEFTFTQPDPHAVVYGLIKSCYLAESVLVGRPLRGERADAVRTQLVSILDGNPPDALSLGEVLEVVEVIYARTSLQVDGRSRPRYAVGYREGAPTMPLISFGRYACSPVFTDDDELAEIVAAWPGMNADGT